MAFLAQICGPSAGTLALQAALQGAGKQLLHAVLEASGCMCEEDQAQLCPSSCLSHLPIVLLRVARVADIAVHSAQLRITEIRQFLQIARRKDHVPFGFSGYMVAGMFDQDARSVKIKKNGSQTKFKIRCSALASFEQMPTTSVI